VAPIVSCSLRSCAPLLKSSCRPVSPPRLPSCVPEGRSAPRPVQSACRYVGKFEDDVGREPSCKEVCRDEGDRTAVLTPCFHCCLLRRDDGCMPQGAVRVSCTAERAEVSGRRMASAGLVAGLAGLVASKAEANVCAANPTACVQGKPVSKYLEENPAKKPSDDSISGIIGFVLVAIGSFESLRLTGGKAVGLRQK